MPARLSAGAAGNGGQVASCFGAADGLRAAVRSLSGVRRAQAPPFRPLVLPADASPPTHPSSASLATAGLVEAASAEELFADKHRKPAEDFVSHTCKRRVPELTPAGEDEFEYKVAAGQRVVWPPVVGQDLGCFSSSPPEQVAPSRSQLCRN